MKRGTLIAFEGLDGAGKSTQVERLGQALGAAKCEVVLTREPTDGPEGQRIRASARGEAPLSPDEELRCFVEDRDRHVAGTIEPGLRAGKVVVTDRYFLSTVAYQGARGFDWSALLAESEARFPLPDLVLLLELDPVVGLERVRERGQAPEVFEKRGFLERAADIFACIDRDYVARIDARGDPDRVYRAVVECVRERLDLL